MAVPRKRLSWSLRRSSPRPNPSGRNRRRPRIEELEPYVLLSGNTFTVTLNTDDGSGQTAGTLSWAIDQVDADTSDSQSSPDTIAFDVNGGGAQEITPTHALPYITRPAIVSGDTQPGYAGKPLIWINGSSSGTFSALYISTGASGSKVEGLDVTNIQYGYGIAVGGNDCVIIGNDLGITPAGALAPNGSGVGLFGSGNTVGGTTAADRNVISGNVYDGVWVSGYLNGNDDNVVEGNFIGTDPTGMMAVPNGQGVGLFDARGTTVGGTAAGSANLISGNTSDGIDADGNDLYGGATTGNVLEGNVIGLSTAGTPLGNGSDGGIFLRMGPTANTIGGTGAAANTISGNAGPGIWISDSSYDVVSGNFIGTDPAGDTGLGNAGDGIEIQDSPGTTIGGTAAGTGNVIADNQGNGVTVGTYSGDTSTIDNAILGNSIYANTALGIDLGDDGVTLNDSEGHSGPNNFQNFPVITAGSSSISSTTVSGTLESTPNTTFTIQFFSSAATDSSGYGQGQTYLGQTEVTTDGTGLADIDATVAAAPSGQAYITATATDPNGNTSEFSEAFQLASAPLGSPLEVTNTGDSGPGSLRAAIQYADTQTGLQTITFDIPGSGVQIISPISALPPITTPVDIEGDSQPGYGSAPLIQLDGTSLASGSAGLDLAAGSAGSTIEGLDITDFSGGDAIDVDSTGNSVIGNVVGLTTTGSVAPNGVGVALDASGNTIGGTGDDANTIAGNTGSGIEITGASNNLVTGNLIGTDAAADTGLGNGGDGITIADDSAGNTIGGAAGNIIADNGGNGVTVGSAPGDTGTIANEVLTNSIFGNTGIGIDLGDDGVTVNDSEGHSGPNLFQDFPVINAATINSGSLTVAGTLNSTPSTTFTLQFFASAAADSTGYGQGQTYLGQTTVTTNGAGFVSFSTNVAAVPTGQTVITATATDPQGDTSEFSKALDASSAPVVSPLEVTNTNDSGPGSLRAAIEYANTQTSLQTITFDIPGAGVQEIELLSSLPPITTPVSIEGDTQPGYAGTPLIQIDGSSLGTDATGIDLTGAAGSTIEGLDITNFSGGNGIAIFATACLVVGNDLGLTTAGVAAPNGVGVLVDASDNTVGGTTAADRNVISGNSYFGVDVSGYDTTCDDNVVEGNDIGTDPTGMTAVPNHHGIGIINAVGTTVGGTAAGSANLISGNADSGVYIDGNELYGGATTGNLVEGNTIGLNAGGAPLGNGDLGGVFFELEASGNTIGGPGAAANTVAGNNGPGVNISDSSYNLISGNFIGTDAAGDTGLGNTGAGVYINFESPGNTIGGTAAGAGNVIADNQGNGVTVGYDSTDTGTVGNSILGNAIDNNVGIGIDLGDDGVTLNDAEGHSGPNNFQNFPVIATATVSPSSTAVAFSLTSTPNTNFTIQFFSSALPDPSGFGQGQTYLGQTTVTTNGAGFVSSSVNVAAAPAGQAFITATATDPQGDTSEFSAAFAMAGAPVLHPLVVTNTNNGGLGSLRGAIEYANAHSGSQTITFDIPGTGVQMIQPSTPLPAINVPVTINGESQAGYAGTPVIQLDGSLVALGLDGLQLATGATGSTIEGLDITNFDEGNAIEIDASSCQIIGDYLGLTTAGVAAQNGVGVNVYGSSNTIGGTTAADRDVISGNFYGIIIAKNVTTVTGNVIEGDYIGTGPSGLTAVPNFEGIVLEHVAGTTIGGTTSGAGNVISGNSGDGINISDYDPSEAPSDTTGNVIEGNTIGLGVGGTVVLGGEGIGLYYNVTGTTIGGTAAGAANTIAGNTDGDAVSIDEGSSNLVEGNFIGTNSSDVTGLGNAGGIVIYGGASANTIGGTAAGAGNTIVGNDSQGISLAGAGTTGNAVEGNFIGTDAHGDSGLGNDGDGVIFSDGASGNTIGGTASAAGNVIENNKGNGVTVGANSTDSTTIDDAILGNSIYANTKLGIDLGDDGVTANDSQGHTGPNLFQDFPVLTAATFTPALGSIPGTTLITGTVEGPKSSTVTVWLYANTSLSLSGYGQGQIPLGFVQVPIGASGSGVISFSTTANLSSASFITATATDADGNTSEFSADVAIVYGMVVPAKVVPNGGFSVNRATKQYSQSVTISNTTGSIIAGPIYLAITNLTPGVTLATPTSTPTSSANPPAGSPAVLLSSSSLPVNQSIVLTLVFNNASGVAITYVPEVLSDPKPL